MGTVGKLVLDFFPDGGSRRSPNLLAPPGDVELWGNVKLRCEAPPHFLPVLLSVCLLFVQSSFISVVSAVTSRRAKEANEYVFADHTCHFEKLVGV